MLQNLSERKKKAAEEKRQLEDELDDVKTTFEVKCLEPSLEYVILWYRTINSLGKGVCVCGGEGVGFVYSLKMN